jgi:replicative DNA helicase
MHANALTDESGLGIPTGFPSLDKATSGLHRGQLWLLGARSNTGKTAFALSVAGNLASGRSQARRHVVFFSLEMSKVELAERVCSDECGVNYGRFNHSSLEKTHVQKIANHQKVFDQWQFVVDDKSSLTVDEIGARARILSPSRGPDLVIVDTLQRVRPRNLRQDRRLQLQQVANDLKDLAKNLNCCVLLCAQLNADAEGKEPDLTHLSEGKQVVEPVDTAVLMHRPNRDDSGVVLKIEKLRRGARKKILIDFDGKFQRFTDRQSVDVAPTGEAWQS